MGGPSSHDLVPFARKLRRNATNAERLLWRALNGRQLDGFRFRRQVPLLGFIVDFMCYEARLVIEVDGATHSTDAELARDAARDEALIRAGNRILRFRNAEIYENLDGVIETIFRALQAIRNNVAADPPPPCPSPTRGEGTPVSRDF